MYCKNCGTRFGGNEKTCETCGFTRGSGLSYCPACGKKAEKGDETCRYCGATIFDPYTKDGRSRSLAGWLAVFLGCLGIHNYYLGYFKKGLMQMILSLLASILSLGYALPVVWLWGFIDGFRILRGYVRVDARGRFLRD
jgi:hypothetical protein